MKRKSLERDAPAKKLTLRAYRRYEGKYGYRQLQLFLQQDDGVWMNHKKVLRLMQELGIQSRVRWKRRY
ncbi:IS3 family transposase [Paenibacillus kribbensis]|uniref:IS3 family transposase n=1 Tax=Paenibacillus kribbensis TaxID=172713 RepID=UPI002DB87E28|nr:IS3 family transposase [Paenibacillus kribbensis]MEC0235125.1 IS3 family transposase [Paenibacillus kribbensis]